MRILSSSGKIALCCLSKRVTASCKLFNAGAYWRLAQYTFPCCINRYGAGSINFNCLFSLSSMPTWSGKPDVSSCRMGVKSTIFCRVSRLSRGVFCVCSIFCNESIAAWAKSFWARHVPANSENASNMTSFFIINQGSNGNKSNGLTYK